MPAAFAEYAATGLVVVVVTYCSIVLGELVPKRLGQSHPEAVARFVARPITWLASATKPFVWLLTESTKALLRVLGVRDRSGTPVTEEEIHAMLAEGTSAGVIERQEHALVRNVFRLDDRQLSSLLVPRGDIVVLDADAPFDENLKLIEDTDHARFPVVKGGMDSILGVLNARRLLARVARGEPPDLTHNLQPPLYVPETVTGLELLDNFRSSGMQMAFVVDEYGEVLGIVTLQDLIEAITGEFQPRNPATSWALRREDGSWLVDGLIPIPELKDRLDLEAVPEEERSRYHTLGGMLMLLFGRLPREGDAVDWERWRFEVVDMDRNKIDKVLVLPLPGAGKGAKAE
jgi:putative hemolysin